ncbi:Homeobox-leucine zipper protein HOX8 [Zea mays]|uniref:Homeobox-leucine zipper protein n=1 Tax=Zea mays TaxID=4577 RepID=A0A3L6D713_MAIZE|nr:Homeobox-leucine zipper protein HOX8 [Zea mays]
MEPHGVDGDATAAAERDDVDAGAYDEEEDEEEELAGSRGGLGEKKRRLAADQVRALERSFEVDNKLDPERKARIARDLSLHPARSPSGFRTAARAGRPSRSSATSPRSACATTHPRRVRRAPPRQRPLAAEIKELRGMVEKQMEVKLESAAEELLPVATRSAAAAAVYNKDGSTDSDSSAVFNEEASPYPYSGAALDHQQAARNQPPLGFTGFTSFLTSSFPSVYHGDSHLDQEADGFFSAAAAGDGFFAEAERRHRQLVRGGGGW